jgi:hypothetical protein
MPGNTSGVFSIVSGEFALPVVVDHMGRVPVHAMAWTSPRFALCWNC